MSEFCCSTYKCLTKRLINASFMASPLHLDMSASKTKKITGTISLSEVSPGADAESSVIFKKTVTDESFLKASSALRDLVLEKMKSFEMEFKTM